VSAEVFVVSTDTEVEQCFEAFKALRPHITRDSFLPQVRRQQQQAYQIVGVRLGDTVTTAAGFRLAEFLAWGKILYIDDLTTLPEFRGRGYGDTLMKWLIAFAKEHQCRAVHLDTGFARHAAHRLYLRMGMHFSSHHLALDFDGAR
jgi:GNAT superfamily N-acetyltransferase